MHDSGLELGGGTVAAAMTVAESATAEAEAEQARIELEAARRSVWDDSRTTLGAGKAHGKGPLAGQTAQV
eukprot:SAG11_NODE_24687_length_369_cov_1.733333_2_plen_69_part_01